MSFSALRKVAAGVATLALGTGLAIVASMPAVAATDQADLVTIDTHGASAPGETAYFSTHPGAEVKARFTYTATSPALLRVNQIASLPADYRLTGESTCAIDGETFLPAGSSCDIIIRFALDRYPTYNVAWATVQAEARPADDAGGAIAGEPSQRHAQAVAFYPNPFSVSSTDFGDVSLGESTSGTIRVTNAYSPSRHSFAVFIPQGPFSLDGTAYLELAPGAFVDIPVSFAPTVLGESHRAVVPAFTRMNTGELLTDPFIALHGTGTAPPITLTASDIDFGTVALGTNGSRTLSISNTGRADTAVSIVDRQELESAGLVVDIPDGTPLSAGESISGRVTWTPAAVDAKAPASIGITHSPFTDPVGQTGPVSPLTVALTGTAVAGPASVEISSVDFGELETGDVGSQVLRFRNSSDRPITLSTESILLAQNHLATAETVIVPAHGETVETITWTPEDHSALDTRIRFVEEHSGAEILTQVRGSVVDSSKPTITPPAPGGSTANPSAPPLATTGGAWDRSALAASVALIALGLTIWALSRRRSTREPS